MEKRIVATITGQCGNRVNIGYDSQYRVITWYDNGELIVHDGDLYDYKAKNEQDAIDYIFRSWKNWYDFFVID